LEIFEEDHKDTLKDTLTKLKQKEIMGMDVNNPKVIQKLKLFDNEHNEIGTNQKLEDISQASNNDEEVQSLAVFQDIWKTCKKASRNHNPSLLMEALHRNNLDVNAIYFTDDVFPDIKRSLLLHAAWKNDVDVVKLLCSIDNIDVNTTNDVYGRTPLMKAAMYNNVDVVRVLLNMNNIDVNITDVFGYTPLMYAARYNNIDVVRVLLNMNNINVNTTDVIGYTALELATSNGYNEIVDLLNNSS